MAASALMQEALFIGGYAAALLVVAAIAAWAARFSHDRIQATKTIGFRFHDELNAWQCSEGTFLWHQESDAVGRVVRYHAKAEICNACALKSVCTDSDDGRTLVTPMDAWPHSEMARFQRVISLSMTVLAGLLCAVEVVRQEEVPVRIAFGTGILIASAWTWRGWRQVRAIRTVFSR